MASQSQSPFILHQDASDGATIVNDFSRTGKDAGKVIGTQTVSASGGTIVNQFSSTGANAGKVIGLQTGTKGGIFGGGTIINKF